ncbi:signal peptidase I [Patescibacteria group bacterium]|nr:signal peptidase I [Patescibacteria group bacterium]
MKTNKNLLISAFLVFGILFILGILILIKFQSQKEIKIAHKEQQKTEEVRGNFQEEIKIVRGNSLEPLVLAGAEIKVLPDYYKYQEIKRDDLALYHYAGNDVPLLKIVKAIPQDTFKLVAKDNNNNYNLFINDKIATNSQGLAYVFNEKQFKMLSLYKRDYNGIIPQNTYLLLGDQVNGSFDSSAFGLVDKSDILGKAVVIK